MYMAACQTMRRKRGLLRVQWILEQTARGVRSPLPGQEYILCPDIAQGQKESEFEPFALSRKGMTGFRWGLVYAMRLCRLR